MTCATSRYIRYTRYIRYAPAACDLPTLSSHCLRRAYVGYARYARYIRHTPSLLAAGVHRHLQ